MTEQEQTEEKLFKDLGLSPEIQQAIDEIGFDKPSPIQAEAIPELLAGHDVIGQAQTGTGKTAAFGLPMLQYLDPANDEVQAIVLTPTRELCIQVTQALRSYAEHLDIEIVGHERPGIVRDLTQALKNLGANIEEFSSGVESAAFTGAEMFRAQIRVGLPETLAPAELRRTLERLAGEIMVDLTLRDD